MFDTVVQMRPSRDELISVDPLRTLYTETGESDALQKSLWLFLDRVPFLHGKQTLYRAMDSEGSSA
jgi:hypothetical protein